MNWSRIFVFVMLFVAGRIHAQKVLLEGYTFADDNSGYLSNVEVLIANGNDEIGRVTSDGSGLFKFELPLNADITLMAKKQNFEEKILRISTKGKKAGEKVYAKMAISRAPGYIFEATLAEEYTPEDSNGVDAITGATIEIYNNTKKREEMVLPNHPVHTFGYTFEKGNHYTIMVRKEGYFTKRIEANVAIDGCILCVEGVGSVTPGMVDNLTKKNTMGTLAANIAMRKITVGKAFKLENIYYDLGKWELRPEAIKELDKLVSTMKDNRTFVIEIGSHTDSRGSLESNKTLSAKRAQSCVDYLVSKGIDKVRLIPTGYGEEKPVNKCADGVKCTEEEYQANRRTEFKITSLLKEDPYKNRTLKQIIEEQAFIDMVMSGEQAVIEIPVGHTPPNNDSTLTATPQNNINVVEIPNDPIIVAPKPPISPSQAIASEKTYRRAVPIPKNYSGYKIMIINSQKEKLPDDNPIFARFGQVFLYETPKGDNLYLIGDFGDNRDAKDYLQKVLISQFPDARLINFAYGVPITSLP